jgi:hypothetical protein
MAGLRADVSVQYASMDAQEYLNAYFPVRWIGRDGQFFSPTFFFYPHLQTSQMFRLRDCSRARRRYSAQYVTHTAYIRHFRATATVTVVSLRIMQWSQFSSLWTAFLEAGLPDRLLRNTSVWPLHNYNCFHFLCIGSAVVLCSHILATEESITSCLNII